MSTVAPVVWELRPVEIEKRVIFCIFFYFTKDATNLGDIFVTEVAKLKTDFKATSRQKNSTAALIALEASTIFHSFSRFYAFYDQNRDFFWDMVFGPCEMFKIILMILLK